MTEASTWYASSAILMTCGDVLIPLCTCIEHDNHKWKWVLRGDDAMPSGYPKFKNDLGVREIRIGSRQFACVGASPPNDHPHVYLDMGASDQISCPYCATVFRYDPAVAPFTADPPECIFVEDSAPTKADSSDR
jgi:uncharacterized Zn-finger protein